MDDFQIGTQGAKATEGGSEWLEPKTVQIATIVDVEAGASKSKGSPFIKITIMGDEPASKPNKYGPGKLSTCNEYYYSTEKAAELSNSRLANFRDALKLPQMDAIQVVGNDPTEKIANFAAQLKAILVGKKAAFLIGGKEGSNGTVYSRVHDFAFIAAPDKAGIEQLQKELAKLGDKLIQRDQPAGGGSSTASASQQTTPTNFSSL